MNSFYCIFLRFMRNVPLVLFAQHLSSFLPFSLRPSTCSPVVATTAQVGANVTAAAAKAVAAAGDGCVGRFFQAAAAAASEVRSRFFFAISAARTTDGLTVARTVGGRCTTDVRYATTDEPSKWMMAAGEGTTDGRIVAALLPSLFFPPPSLNLPSECCSRLPRWIGAK